VVVCVDEKSQIQALDRTAPLLPMRFDAVERRTHDYRRHGTTTLFAALEVATGKITSDACYERHSNIEFLAFLKQVGKAHRRVKLHVHSVPDLVAAIRAFIDAYNDRCEPFRWNKIADQILAKATRN
jgi:hypothetical protein